MRPPVWAGVMILGVGSATARAEPERAIPEVGMALLAGPVGQQRTSVGGEAELGWSLGRFGLAAEGSLLGVQSDNATTGHSWWLGLSGRLSLVDTTTSRTSATGAREVVFSALLLELVVQREWWTIVEHVEPPPVGPDRNTIGLGIAGRFRVVDERAPNLAISTRLFARVLASETPVATSGPSGVHYAHDFGFVLGLSITLGQVHTTFASTTTASIASAQ